MRKWSVEIRNRFYELVCSGGSVNGVAGMLGVPRTGAMGWWLHSAPMELSLVPGRAGGVAGSAPNRDPGSGRSDPVRRCLTSEDRAVIAAGLRAKWSHQKIGEAIGRDRSVISREVKRNTGPDGRYWAPLAHRAAHERRRRPKPFKLMANPGLCRLIEGWMDQGWSPKLIALVLAGQCQPGHQHTPEQMMGRVSHETIYRALYVQGRGQLRKDLYQQLSTKRAGRRSRTGPHGSARSRSPYRDAFTISQRPPEVADRAVPGHWEGDLVLGTAGRSAVGVLVERTTRFTILLHLPDRHDADTVAAAMIAQMNQLPERLRQSLTWDRGTELARYDKIQLELSMPVYFCDPHAPWQRGTGENTNRLLRHWLTKGSDLSRFTAADLHRIAASLNARPRPTQDLDTPAQALDQLLTNPAAA